MLSQKKGKIFTGVTLKSLGFFVIAIGGTYAGITKDFRIGSLIIAIGALIAAVGDFL